MDIKTNSKKIIKLLDFLEKRTKISINCLSDKIKYSMQEIRIRVGAGISIICPEGTYFFNSNGKISKNYPTDFFMVTPWFVNDFLQAMCNYSLYSYQNQIKHGFITLDGGHRVGIAGSVVMYDDKISNIKNVTSLNIRVAKEIKGCAENIFENIKNDDCGVLIVGPPGCGKTTVLRDLARIISSCNSYRKVTIVDERFEISGCFEGIPQFDVGLSDILSGFPKNEGIMRATRALSPDVIICDEIGSKNNAESVLETLNCGIHMIASIHAANLDEFLRCVYIDRILNSGAFGKIIFLKDMAHPGEITDIYKVSDIYDKSSRCDNFIDIRCPWRINNI